MLLLKTGKIRGAEIAMGPKAETGFGLCRYKIHLKAVAGNAQRRNRKRLVFVISCLFADKLDVNIPVVVYCGQSFASAVLFVRQTAFALFDRAGNSILVPTSCNRSCNISVFVFKRDLIGGAQGIKRNISAVG